MKSIWKWPLKVETTIDMPLGTKMLDVQIQHGDPVLWALVDPEADTAPRRFVIYGTGHNLSDNPGQYIGTFQMDDGSLVFHLFEIPVTKPQ